VDGRAAIAALLGVAIGTVLAVCVGERRWWNASAFCALGTAFELGIMTEGNHSRVEHDVVFAVELLLITFWLVVATAGIRARRRDHL
jgi:hypothetical protein